jgi:acetyl-CoA carboxylase carboxyl transferase subunit alpha
MLKNKLIDGIIKEPAGGAHSNKADMVKRVKKEVIKTVETLEAMDKEVLLEERINKFCEMGVYSN